MICSMRIKELLKPAEEYSVIRPEVGFWLRGNQFVRTPFEAQFFLKDSGDHERWMRYIIWTWQKHEGIVLEVVTWEIVEVDDGR